MSDLTNSSSLSFVVGTVREINGTAVLIRLFENTSQLVHFFKGEKYSGIIIGSYVELIVDNIQLLEKWRRNMHMIK